MSVDGKDDQGRRGRRTGALVVFLFFSSSSSRGRVGKRIDRDGTPPVFRQESLVAEKVAAEEVVDAFLLFFRFFRRRRLFLPRLLRVSASSLVRRRRRRRHDGLPFPHDEERVRHLPLPYHALSRAEGPHARRGREGRAPFRRQAREERHRVEKEGGLRRQGTAALQLTALLVRSMVRGRRMRRGGGWRGRRRRRRRCCRSRRSSSPAAAALGALESGRRRGRRSRRGRRGGREPGRAPERGPAEAPNLGAVAGRRQRRGARRRVDERDLGSFFFFLVRWRKRSTG